MKERPILFSAPMVRALLAGTKTQTRRIIKRQPDLPRAIYAANGADTVITPTLLACENGMGLGWQFAMTKIAGPCGPLQCLVADYEPIKIVCPYGQPGDRLWVRETWYCDDFRVQRGPYLKPDDMDLDEARADGTMVYRDSSGDRPYEAEQPVWRPAIHMPRWASRITLEITGVRVERLQDISESDCVAEGCAGGHGSIPGYAYSATPLEHYHWLWNSINGPGSWEANPWVWVVEFPRVEA